MSCECWLAGGEVSSAWSHLRQHTGAARLQLCWASSTHACMEVSHACWCADTHHVSCGAGLSCSCRQHVNRVLNNTGQIKSELARCLLAEFLGTLLFQLFGGAAPPKDTTAPAANGFALVCISEFLCTPHGHAHAAGLLFQLFVAVSAAASCMRALLHDAHGSAHAFNAPVLCTQSTPLPTSLAHTSTQLCPLR